jgi:hypothetical protein
MLVQDLDFDKFYQKAKQKAQKMLTNGLYSRFGLSQKQRMDKAVLGCLGELAFEEYLKQKGVVYVLDTSDFGNKNTDEFDFLVKGKKIDVKVAKKSTQKPPNDNWTYGYPKEQNPSTKDFIIVGWVDFTNKEVGFYGWMSGKRISQYKVVSTNSFVGYPYLTPNHEFRWGDLNKF